MIRLYLKRRLSILVLYLSLWMVFPTVGFLFGNPPAAALWSIYIISFFFAVWLVCDFVGFYKRTAALDGIIKTLGEYPPDLPKPENRTQEQYIEVIGLLYKMLSERTLILQESYNEQNEYYTTWVHQMKTPLFAMRLLLESDKSVSGDTRLLLLQEIFKTEQYTEMALHYVKARELSANMLIDKYNLLDLVRRSVKKYAALFILKKLSAEIDEKLDFEIYTDAKWFSFIIEQLLSNAIKYTADGGVRLYADDKTLVISDSGIGILAADAERIFEKGYTGYNGRENKQSSGIGLYLVQKIARQLSVEISVSSAVGEGTQVFVKAPESKEEIFDNTLG